MCLRRIFTNVIFTNSGVVAVDFCCSRFLSLAIVVAKSVGSSYTGDILSSSNSRSASDMLSPHKPLCSVERPSRHKVCLFGAAVKAALLSSFIVAEVGLDLDTDFGNCCGITAAVADAIPSLKATVIVP